MSSKAFCGFVLLHLCILFSCATSKFLPSSQQGRDWVRQSPWLRKLRIVLREPPTKPRGSFDFYPPDNREPFDADSFGEITCIGPLPPVEWPERVVVDEETFYVPERFTLQQLCAKPQYGGALHGHLGGYCHDHVSPHGSWSDFENYDRKSVQKVVFDISPASGSSAVLNQLRLRAYCLQHCFCTNYRDNSPPKDKSYGTTPPGDRFEADSKYQNNPDRDVFTQRQQPLDCPRDGAQGLRIPFLKQIRMSSAGLPYDWQDMFLAESNRIVCRGPLPRGMLPGPFKRVDFENLQSLCANALDGGNVNANAGLYCNTRNLAGDVAREPAVDTTHELIPSLYFIALYDLPGHPDEYADRNRALIVQEYCLERCKCKEQKTTTTITPTPTPLAIPTPPPVPTPASTSRRLILSDAMAKIVIIVAENGLAVTRTYQLVGEETGTCSSSSQQQCDGDEMLPSKYLPRAPARATGPPQAEPHPVPLQRHAPSTRPGPPRCGGYCSSYADCVAPGESSSGCRCVANPDPLFIRQVGADPVGAFALCVFTAGLVRGSSAVMRLGGRDVERPRRGSGGSEGGGKWWWEQPDLPCACNRTYVSRACCESKSGVLWEEAGRGVEGLR